jgi:hypothetical protein
MDEQNILVGRIAMLLDLLGQDGRIRKTDLQTEAEKLMRELLILKGVSEENLKQLT